MDIGLGRIRQLIRGMLTESAGEPEGMLLYHATCFPPEAFIDGINPRASAGYGQGSGFYLFTSRKAAAQHARTLESDKGGVSKEVRCEPGSDGRVKAYLVVVDTPVTPENFDIDYEVYGEGLLRFIDRNWERFKEIGTELGILKFNDNMTPDRRTISMRTPGSMSRLSLSTSHPTEGSLRSGEALSYVASRLAEVDPDMFIAFEREVLRGASAIKYNGSDRIIPLQIEDIEGNIIWSR